MAIKMIQRVRTEGGDRIHLSDEWEWVDPQNSLAIVGRTWCEHRAARAVAWAARDRTPMCQRCVLRLKWHVLATLAEATGASYEQFEADIAGLIVRMLEPEGGEA